MKSMTAAHPVNVNRVQTGTLSLPALFGTTWEKLGEGYYGLMVVTLLVGSCVAGIAAAFILQNGASLWQLSLCASLGMFNNTTAIGHMPVKWVAWSFLVSMIGNTGLILANAF